MLTFFEFYETLLSFVLYKLYGELGVRYPLPTAVATPSITASSSSDNMVVSSTTLHPTLGGKATSVLAANLNSLQMALKEVSKGNSAADAVKDALQNEGDDGDNKKTSSSSSKASKKKQRQLMQSIDEALKGVKDDDDESDNGSDNEEMKDEEDQMPIAAPLREALDAIDDSAINDENNTMIITDPQAQKRHQLFANLTFYLSREVPRGYLELIILSYGGSVGWEGQDSPIRMDDASITHHIVDRPKLLPNYAKLPKSREYIQPQWILDCANFNFILPIQKYSVGSALPPHLSPWVNDAEEGYVPKYKEEVERLKNGEVLDASDDEDAMNENKADKESDKVAESSSSSSEDEDETPTLEKENDDAKEGDESESSEDEDDNEEEEERKALKKKVTEVSTIILNTLHANSVLLTNQPNLSVRRDTQDEEAALLAKSLMSKKAARLYGRMQHGIAQKQAKVDNLHKKRREIESSREKSKDGKTVNKLKVERLKKERRDKERKYSHEGQEGSMKKRRRK